MISSIKSVHDVSSLGNPLFPGKFSGKSVHDVPTLGESNKWRLWFWKVPVPLMVKLFLDFFFIIITRLRLVTLEKNLQTVR